MNEYTIYHGSNMKIERPEKNKGRPFNDYGKGFYCTFRADPAAQWACKFQEDGIVNQYVLNPEKLDVLHLNENYNILNWLAILVENREFTGATEIENAQYILDNYGLDYKQYDIVIGYRADDAYFRIVREFLNNSIGLNTLDEAMYLGELGLQVFIQSERAFHKLRFVSSYEVDQEKYYPESVRTIEHAIDRCEKLKKSNEQEDLFIRKIKGGGINEDRIPKIKIK